MPTLEDLREAFAELERQAPPALSEPVRPTHRRRWAAAGLAAACTAAVAVTVPLAIRSGDAPSRPGGSAPISVTTGPSTGFTHALPAPANGQSPDLAYGFAIPDTVAGYTVVPDEITRTYQHASIYGPTDPPGGQVFVFYRGAFDVGIIASNQVDEVDGGQGYYADLRLPGADQPVEALVWQYADNGWAVVRLGVDTGDAAAKGQSSKAAHLQAEAQRREQTEFARANELLLAEALVPNTAPLRSPVRIVDQGLHVDSISSGGPDGGIDLADAGGAAWDLGWSPGTLSPSDKTNAGTVTLGAHEWIVYTSDGTPSSLGLIADNWGLTVTPSGTASLDQMEQFAASLHVAPDPSNADTWYDAGANLP